jgi:hypothetical protein
MRRHAQRFRNKSQGAPRARTQSKNKVLEQYLSEEEELTPDPDDVETEEQEAEAILKGDPPKLPPPAPSRTSDARH